jgi:Protein of unknown function (DUF3467)
MLLRGNQKKESYKIKLKPPPKVRGFNFYIMAEEKKHPAQNQINIELSEEIAEGIYSNLAMIAHSNSEFVIDFIRLMPGVPKARVKSRIIITPEHAKRLLAALKDNINKYEATFGPIKQTNEAPQFPMNFGGTVGEA